MPDLQIVGTLTEISVPPLALTNLNSSHTGLQSKPDWKGFAIAAFNGAAGTSVKAGLGEGMVAASAYTGVTVTGDMLIRGEPVSGDVLSAVMVGSMVGNYAGQKGREYAQKQSMSAPANDYSAGHHTVASAENQSRKASYSLASRNRPRPQTAQDKQMLAAERVVNGEQTLSDPVLDVSAGDQASEVNPAKRFIRGVVNGARNIPSALYDAATTPVYMQTYKTDGGLFSAAVMFSTANTGTRAEMLGNMVGTAGGTALLGGAAGVVGGLASGRATLFSLAPRASLRMQMGEVGLRVESSWQVAEKALETMEDAQIKNLKRFIDKLPQNSENIRVRNFLDGGKVFQADSPASNIPGSFARYEKQIDISGNTVLYTKTTFDPNGEVVHVAPKFPSGPKIYPDFEVSIHPGFDRR